MTYNIGDRVRVIGKQCVFKGHLGYVVSVGAFVHVKLDDDAGTYAYNTRTEIEKIASFSGDSDALLAEELRAIDKRMCEIYKELIDRGYEITSTKDNIDLMISVGGFKITKLVPEHTVEI